MFIGVADRCGDATAVAVVAGAFEDEDDIGVDGPCLFEGPFFVSLSASAIASFNLSPYTKHE